MGTVQILDENLKQLWTGGNTVTSELERRMLIGLTRPVVPPTHMAVGAGIRPISETPWDQSNLVSEMQRRLIDGSFVDPISNRAFLIGAFRIQNINTIWRELGLFDGAELSDYGSRVATSCESLNSTSTTGQQWQTHADHTLLTEYTSTVEGVAALRLNTGSTAALLFRNDHLGLFGFKKQTLTSDVKNTRLQFHLGISDVSLMAEPLVVKVYVDGNDTTGWQWSVALSELSSGYNFVDLFWKDAAEIGVPGNKILVDRFELSSLNRQDIMIFTLDQIRLYRDSGTLLARTQINPAIVKGHETLVVNWAIEPFSTTGVV